VTRTSIHPRAWLELVRLPNLPTVPGGVAAGYLLGLAARPASGLARFPAAAAAVTLLYMAGLALNDWADAGIDARERPGRPIPSGRLTRRQALWASAALGAVGMAFACAAGWACAAVCAAVALTAAAYDLASVRGSPIGWLLMGACRVLTVLAGAAAASSWAGLAAEGVLVAGGILGAYTVTISGLAAREADLHVPGARRWLPLGVAVVGAAGVYGMRLPGATSSALMLLAGALSGVGAVAGLTGAQPPERVGRAVGALIRGMIPLQAALCLAAGVSTPMAAGVIALYPVSWLLSARFHAS
jgi:4-hydroxybenzoate polyprenyltransferase